MAETQFYQKGNVVVTNTRAVIGGNTYALANITSVKKVTLPVNYQPMVYLIGIGAVVAYLGFGSFSSTVMGVIGVLLIVGGIALALTLKPNYAVSVGSAGGETQAITSQNSAEIDEIVGAVSNAIVHRG